MRIPKYMSILAVLILLGASFVPVCSGEVSHFVEESDHRGIDTLTDFSKNSSSEEPIDKEISPKEVEVPCTVAEVNVYYTRFWGFPLVGNVTIEILTNSTNPINVTLKKNQPLDVHVFLTAVVKTHPCESSLSKDTTRNIFIGGMAEEMENMSPPFLNWLHSILYVLSWYIICHLPGIERFIEDFTKFLGTFTVWLKPENGISDNYPGGYTPISSNEHHLTCAVSLSYYPSSGTVLARIPYTIEVYLGEVKDPYTHQPPFTSKRGFLKVPLNIQVEDKSSSYASAVSSKKEETMKEESTHILVHCGNVTVKWKALLLPEIEEDIPSTINFNINLTDETEYVHFIYVVRTALVPPSFKILPTIALYLIKAGKTGDYYVATTQSTHLFVLDHTFVARKGTTETWKVYVAVYAFPLFAYSERTIHLTAHFQ